MNQSTNVHPINDTVNFNQPTVSQSPQQATKPQVSKPTEVLPTSRMTFEKQFTLLRAFATAHAHFGRPVSVKEVSEVANMLPDTLSTANAFFIDVGLLQKNDGKFTPCNELVAFNHAYQWNSESATSKLLPVFQDTWFAKRLTPKLLMGSKLTEDEAITELAAASNASVNYKNPIKILLDYLNEVGIISRDNGMIYLGNTSQSNIKQDTEKEKVDKPSALQQSTPSEIHKELPRNINPPINQMTAGTIQFSINVKIDMSEFAGWDGDRITRFFAGIAQVLAAKASIDEKR